MARRVVNSQELRDWRAYLRLREFASEDDERLALWCESIQNLEDGFRGLDLSEATVDSLIIDSLSHALANDEGLDEWVYDHTPEGWRAADQWPVIRSAAGATIYQMCLYDRERQEEGQ